MSFWVHVKLPGVHVDLIENLETMSHWNDTKYVFGMFPCVLQSDNDTVGCMERSDGNIL